MIGGNTLVYDAIFTLLGGENSIFQGSVTQPRHTWQHFLNEIVVHSKKITPNPEYSTQLAFWKLSAKAFGLKIFSRDDSQGIKLKLMVNTVVL